MRTLERIRIIYLDETPTYIDSYSLGYIPHLNYALARRVERRRRLLLRVDLRTLECVLVVYLAETLT